ncbi:MAG: CheR family methyltransferase [Ignavibacteriales bacterium]
MEPFQHHVYQKYSDFLYQATGISIGEQKEHLLLTKLSRLLRKKQLDSADDYLKLLSQPGNKNDLQEFINMMTTNTTEFFRENDHFDFLKNNIGYLLEQNPRIVKDRVIRVWSSACSTGQEPITLAIVLHELLKQQIEVRILATDISSQVLLKAMSGTYNQTECLDIPSYYLQKYFEKQGEQMVVKDEIHRLVKYRLFNLMSPYHFRKGFDIIFCRNVMIYFDSETQQQLIDKFYPQLPPGGLFFLGHSESLINKRHSFKPVGHSIYVKA